MSSFPFYPSTATSTPLYGGAQFPPPPPTPSHIELSHLGLRYATAISIGFLLLLAVVLFSYICFRFYRRGRLHQNPNPNPNSNAVVSDNGIMLPRVIFVAEDDDGDGDTENAVVGLDRAVINSYPKFPFVRGGGNETVCAICLCEYKEAEMLRMLPDCRHYFHLTCVDEWLKLNASCPVCRNSPLPTPLSTPLSEVVPLSLYTDGRNRRR